MSLKGKIIVVSEAGNGVGKATAIALTKKGADVIGLSKDSAALEHTLSIVHKHDDKIPGNGSFTPVVGDVTNPNDVAKLFVQAKTKGETINGVVCIVEDTQEVALIGQTEEELWYDVIKESLTIPMQVTRAAVQAMKEKGGSIVIVHAQQIVEEGIKGLSQSVSRMGLIGLSRNVAKSIPGICSNLILTQVQEGPKNKNVADAAAFLLDSAAAGINAQVLKVK